MGQGRRQKVVHETEDALPPTAGPNPSHRTLTGGACVMTPEQRARIDGKGSARRAFRRWPTIEIGYEDDPGPFMNRIEFLVTGKRAVATAAAVAGTILSRRPSGTNIPMPSTWRPPVFPSAPVEPSGHLDS